MCKIITKKLKKNVCFLSHKVQSKSLKKIPYLARSIFSKPFYESRINHRKNVNN